jgi:predicted negative regulator of RcsB-dependent stress response
MLLAQTYAEVGEVEKGLQLLRELKAKEPENLKIDLVLASVLGKSNNPAELNEALKLLAMIEQKDESKIGPILLQRGRLYIKMGEKESARKEWEQALTRLPEGSGYRKQAELELARLN